MILIPGLHSRVPLEILKIEAKLFSPKSAKKKAHQIF